MTCGHKLPDPGPELHTLHPRRSCQTTKGGPGRPDTVLTVQLSKKVPMELCRTAVSPDSLRAYEARIV